MEEIALRAASEDFTPAWVWGQLLDGPAQAAFQAMVGRAIVSRRWFGAKTKTIRAVEILDAIPLDDHVRLVLVQLNFVAGPKEVYQLPLALATGGQAQHL
jgi:maltose alpha-D-glucosyltransferase / alpha-amylase